MHRSTRKANAGGGEGGNIINDFEPEEAFPDDDGLMEWLIVLIFMQNYQTNSINLLNNSKLNNFNNSLFNFML